MILVGNNDRNLRFPDNLITDFKNRLKGAGAGNRKVFEAVSAQMIRNRASCRFDHVRLCLDIARNASCMGAPIIQKLRHMDDMLRIVRQAQNHVMILTAVKFCPKQLRAVQQFSGKYAEMTDIVVGAQVVDGIIRLEVHRDHLVDVRALKRRLITVNKVRILFVDRLYIFVKGAGMQNIVVVKQPDKLAGCKLIAFVRVARNALVFGKLLINDSRILRRQPFAVFADIGVRIVRTVRQTQLPVFVGLPLDGADHLG